MPISRTVPVSRRALLAGAVSGVAALTSGCEALGPSAPGDSESRPANSPTVVPPVPGPDRILVTEVGVATAALVVLLEEMARGRPRLGRRLAPLLETHRAHQQVLTRALAVDAALSGTTPTASPDAGPVELADLLARERALHERLVADADQAADGGVARLLAVLAAALAQQLHLLEGVR